MLGIQSISLAALIEQFQPFTSSADELVPSSIPDGRKAWSEIRLQASLRPWRASQAPGRFDAHGRVPFWHVPEAPLPR